ncbi:MAG: tetratricopeptide repeat protein, partial [Desulfarculaceae bacterium]
MNRPLLYFLFSLLLWVSGCAGILGQEPAATEKDPVASAVSEEIIPQTLEEKDPLESANLLFKNKRYHEAAIAYASLPEEMLQKPQVLKNLRIASEMMALAYRQLSYAVARAQRCEFHRAEQHLQKALRKYPHYEAALALQQRCLVMQQLAPPASKETESASPAHAVQKDTPEARYCFNLGLFYFERGDLAQAEYLWTKAYNLDPTLPGTKSSLVELLTNQG